MISGCSLYEMHISASSRLNPLLLLQSIDGGGDSDLKPFSGRAAAPAYRPGRAGWGHWNSLKQIPASLHRLGGFLELEKLVLDFLGVGSDLRDDCLGLVPGELDVKARELRGKACCFVAPRKRNCAG